MLISFLFIFSGLLNPAVPIDPLIQKELKNKNTADILCVLKSPYEKIKDLTEHFDTKEQKGIFVYTHLQEYANKSQASLISYLKAHHYAFNSFFIVNAIRIPQADQKLIEYLSILHEVHRIEFNSPYQLIRPVDPVSLHDLETRSPLAIEWGILRIKADSVWALGFRGQGITVGSEDTGVELHPAIKNNYRGFGATLDHNYNWHDAIHVLNPLNKDANQNEYNNPCGLDTIAPCDDDNHGTHTTGIMAASDFQIGVAPEAKWIGCRCMERGWGMLTTYIECFQWFLAPTDTSNKNPDPRKAPHVINNSWGCPSQEGCNPSNFRTMEVVVNTLKAAGIFVTVSAGNSGALGCGSISDPAAIFESSFTVGATNVQDTIAGFSSRGPVSVDGSNRLKPNISAPGVSVKSTIKNGQYASFSGTSMSGPHVAASVALILSAFPQLAGKVDLLENILESSADHKFTQLSCGRDSLTTIPNNIFGYGRLNVLKAYRLANIFMTTPVQIQKNDLIKIYPNPAHDLIIIDAHQAHILSVELINVQGGIVKNERKIDQSQYALETNGLTAGYYFYKINTDQGQKTGKLIIQ